MMKLVQGLFLLGLIWLSNSHPTHSGPEHGNPAKPDELKTLVLLHTLFRHGNRTAQKSESYELDPYLDYDYFPYGKGQLTNAGKRREYSIGEALKKKYKRFLGQYYYPNIADLWSTNYNRTKASLQLLVASLWAPRGPEVWIRDLNWQPVPYNYNPTDSDKVLMGINCPNWVEKYNDVKYNENFQAQYDEYKDTFDYISENTGLNVTSFAEVYNLYFALSTEEEYGLILPEWTRKVWPEPIITLSWKEYFVETATDELNALASGYLVKKIIADTQDKIANIDEEHGKKIYLYSAHENNLAELLIYLGVFDDPHVPTYGSYIVFEVHCIDGVYGIKLFYQHYVSDEPKLLKLPGCDEFCPLETFTKLYEKLLPSEELCGK